MMQKSQLQQNMEHPEYFKFYLRYHQQFGTKQDDLERYRCHHQSQSTRTRYCQMLQNVVEIQSMDRAALCFPQSINLQLALRFPPLLHSFDALCFPPSLACMPKRFYFLLPGLRSLLLSSLSVTCCRHFPDAHGGFFKYHSEL